MTGWNEGYAADIGYVTRYFSPLSPQRLRLTALASGVRHSVGQELNYLELGFGQGLTFVIHAATNLGEFWGTDFMPDQAATARDLLRAAHVPATALEASFQDLALRDDLPEFDMIVLHGIWSWVSTSARAAIVDIIRRRLRPGGLVLISYNCAPGWSGMMPVRDLMMLIMERSSASSVPTAEKVRVAVDFMQKFAAHQGPFFRLYPGVEKELQKMGEHEINYLIHEYFNQDWTICTFADLTAQLSREAKLSYVGPMNPMEMVDDVFLPDGSKEILDSVSDLILREQLRDFLINRRFRMDCYVKGRRPIEVHVHRHRFTQVPFVMMVPRVKVATTVRTSRGEVKLRPELYEPLLDALAADDYAPKSMVQLADYGGLGDVDAERVSRALLLLTGIGALAPAQDTGVAAKVSARAFSMNQVLLDQAEETGGIDSLASAVVGGGISVGRLDQLFVRAIAGGAQNIVPRIRNLLKVQDAKLQRAGKPLETEDDITDMIQSEFVEFQAQRAPLYRRHGLM